MTYGWWIKYIGYLKKSSFAIHSLAPLTSLLSIFNEFGRKKKRQLQREDTQMKKEEHQGQQHQLRGWGLQK